MKATVCDFCGKVTPTGDMKSMLYDIMVCGAEGYEATTAKEKALKFEAEGTCADCTERVHAALTKLKKELKNYRGKKGMADTVRPENVSFNPDGGFDSEGQIQSEVIGDLTEEIIDLQAQLERAEQVLRHIERNAMDVAFAKGAAMIYFREKEKKES